MVLWRSRLTAGAPAGRAPGSRGAHQKGLTVRPRAARACRPAVAVEPGGRRIAPVPTDGGQGAAGDPADVVAQDVGRIRPQQTRRNQRVPSEAPEDFIGHPVADSGKNRLIKQKGLDRSAVAAAQVPVQPS